MLEVKRELKMTRLLTLTGAGGSGKTRLALEVARDLIESYPDGVWLVKLAPLSEGDLVPRAVAKVLGVPERPGEPLTDTLMDVIRFKNLLVVLDNCEHLVDAAARLVDTLLSACPQPRFLTTSREALRVEGEYRWVVPPLSAPAHQHSPTVRELESSESARLFSERALQRDPAFILTAQNAQVVAEICKKLEGLPLAIELAAARVGTLSLEQISEKLEGSLELLSRGGRRAVHRQQTLRGALDWSYDLLSEPERNVFRRLSVFAGDGLWRSRKP
jgi:predicted ATPase